MTNQVMIFLPTYSLLTPKSAHTSERVKQIGVLGHSGIQHTWRDQSSQTCPHDNRGDFKKPEFSKELVIQHQSQVQ